MAHMSWAYMHIRNACACDPRRGQYLKLHVKRVLTNITPSCVPKPITRIPMSNVRQLVIPIKANDGQIYKLFKPTESTKHASALHYFT